MLSQADNVATEKEFRIRLDTFAAQMSDWAEVMAVPRSRPLTPDVVRYVVQIEAGPAVLYLLAKYPMAIPDLNVLPSDRAHMAIDQLVRDCTPYGSVNPAQLFDIGAAMTQCIDRHRLFRWIPVGRPN